MGSECADCKFNTSKNWFDALETHEDFHSHEPFDCSGRHVIKTNWHDTCQHLITNEIDPTFSAQPSIQKLAVRDYEDLRKYFLFSPLETVRKTFAATTQYARSGWITGHIYNTHQAPFPALNVACRHEPVATDTIYSDTPAVDDGSTCAQFFTGLDTKFCDAYGMKTDGDFVTSLLDVICKWGAMDKLVSDQA